MKSEKLLDEDLEKNLTEKISKRIEEDVREAEATPAPTPTDMFDFVYEKIPANLSEQRDSLVGFLQKGDAKK
jgi:pyruvate dehydrogenase E1 component alpha subunit